MLRSEELRPEMRFIKFHFKFHENLSSESRVVSCRRTDRHGEATANAPIKKESC